MEWKKLGLIWNSSKCLSWGNMGTLTPTPYLIGNNTIRVYCGIRDEHGIGRIGYFDVLESDPCKVIGFSTEPILDIGIPGAFDDNGMLLGDIIKVGDSIRMYYVGFQLQTKAKFLAFGGLAVSEDNGNSFTRYSNAPIIDRDDGGLFIRAIHGIRALENGGFKIWFSQGSSWEIIDGKPFPNYSIATMESADGLTFARNKGESIHLQRPNEYRLGRSRVFSFGENYHVMTFTYGKPTGEYESGYAESSDLVNWVRKDNWGLYPGAHSFDSRHLAYPALIRTNNDEIYCFYNGDDMGNGGIGVAKLINK
jgi:hypothetical protein